MIKIENALRMNICYLLVIGGNFFMIPALLIIDEKLKEAGMSQVEIDHLMARFLEEEAFDFVECVNLAKQEEDIVIH